MIIVRVRLSLYQYKNMCKCKLDVCLKPFSMHASYSE